ncbi:GNAT family N-acetyltransferase [Cetobacterium somerae]|uniref:GNAT family N-acetyltransferase n=2 Tax=Cetobacterium TaxID=180162 RepID=UPI001F0512E9|nr:GNAT family N-acetyltransferase [Cetobacterium somerae]MCX3066540.1 GNAT family N-acetyltransferase [Cetobacterium somerae]UPO98199.1 GNAT family N-acetyltransferase [Cetobacterium somerae]
MYKSYIYEDIENKLEEFQELDKNFFLDKEGMYYTIENKNEIIAYILLEKNENDYELKRIFVRKDERFKSYGTKLLLFIINKKIKKGNLIVGKDNSISDFLIKIGFKKKEDGEFIIEDVENKDFRKKEGQKTVIASIFWNIILAATKIGFGYIGKSRALLADGFNSLSDVVTSSGILLGIHFSNIPEDESHPFGHEKIESVIGVIMGIFMILTAFELGKGGVEILFSGEKREVPEMLTVYFALFSSVVKYFMYKQKIRVGLETENSALIADAKDSRNDIFASLGVVLGILLSIYVNPIFDLIISILVAVLIFKEGVSVILETTDTILDKQDMEFIEEIKKYIYENTDIKNVHDIMMRKSGDKIFLELHIRVPKDMSVYNAHKISDDLENSIKEDFPLVKNVIIHLDCLLN